MIFDMENLKFWELGENEEGKQMAVYSIEPAMLVGWIINEKFVSDWTEIESKNLFNAAMK